jgi:MYXO-CTERM domain-containing protein
MAVPVARIGVGCAVLVAGGLLGERATWAAPLPWKGHDWNVTSGAMAGVAQGSPSNVSIDASGYLHLKITKTGSTWTAAELFTTDRLGFGTYQWQIDGAIDHLDPNVVVGLFPYGPAAGIGQDGTNEIDIEYAYWAQPSGPNGDWTDYPASGSTVGELSYTFSLSGGTYSTSRFIWASASIEDFLMTGFRAVGDTTGLLKSWTYAPATPATNIPQQALPLGMNLWCFQAPPSNGQDVEIVIRDFTFVAEGTQPDAGTIPIADAGLDAGMDAAPRSDASTIDAGPVSPEGGPTSDATAGGSTDDAGAGAVPTVDGATPVDAASSATNDAGGAGGGGGGCGCKVARDDHGARGAGAVLLAVVAWVGRRRRRPWPKGARSAT